MGLFELFEGGVDRGAFVGRDLVAVLFKLFLRGEDQAVGGVDLVDAFALLLIFGFVGFGFVAHPLDFLFGKA